MWIAGFDPGGKKKFGWCIACDAPDQRLEVTATGWTSHAREAIDLALAALPHGAALAAAGIDSPLCWSMTGSRRSDLAVRGRIKQLGAPSPGGIAQEPNSLRGACLVQGMLAARLLKSAMPGVRITESHPKALLWLLGLATRDDPKKTIRLADLRGLLAGDVEVQTEHERDAVLGALTALAMLEAREGWHDLARDEGDVFYPVGDVEYWMPEAATDPH